MDCWAWALAAWIWLRTWPRSRMRHVTVGPADQYLLPPENQSLTAKLWKPATPVRVNFGNSSAVWTPTLAVSAANWRSARRTSGRRRSKSDGRPTATLGGGFGIGAVSDSSGN